MAVDAAVADVERGARDDGSLVARDGDGRRVLHARKPGADVGDEIGDLRFEITAPQTGMYGLFGFADSPRPWSMIVRQLRDGQRLADDFSAGTSGETPPSRSPWHWAHANWTKSWAPAATGGSTEVEPAAPAATVPTVLVRFV